MTPAIIAERWDLDPLNTERLERDFVDGTFFCLAQHYSLHSFSDYAKASIRYGSKYTLQDAQIEGQSLPAYHTFKSQYPEYFV